VRKAVLASNMVMFDGRGKTTEETIKALLDAARSGPERDGRLANYGAPSRSPPAPAQGAARHLPSPHVALSADSATCCGRGVALARPAR
jgi:hypothetical protein